MLKSHNPFESFNNFPTGFFRWLRYCVCFLLVFFLQNLSYSQENASAIKDHFQKAKIYISGDIMISGFEALDVEVVQISISEKKQNPQISQIHSQKQKRKQSSNSNKDYLKRKSIEKECKNADQIIKYAFTTNNTSKNTLVSISDIGITAITLPSYNVQSKFGKRDFVNLCLADFRNSTVVFFSNDYIRDKSYFNSFSIRPPPFRLFKMAIINFV